ncbi:hypothetical protein ACQ859_18430 [Roseateles chitinivorans]|uniref:hypothetical protein n=1 Tax=Roseateles chitinivorans TaxID=2917965 RepID=UPI003D6696F6
MGQAKFLRIYARNPEMGTRVFEYREGSVIDGANFTAWRRGDWGQGGNGGWEIDAHDDGAFVILGARYGVADASIDVTGRLRELARRDAKVQVTNDLFRDDPAVGRTKTLRIYARERGGEVRVFDYREGAWIDGANFSGWGRGDWAQDGWRGNWEGRPWGGNAGGYGPGQDDNHLHIVRALYGAHGRDADVTEHIRSLNRGDALAVWVNNDLAGRDPAYGEAKTLRVFFTIGHGPEQLREAGEGERLRLP